MIKGIHIITLIVSIVALILFWFNKVTEACLVLIIWSPFILKSKPKI